MADRWGIVRIGKKNKHEIDVDVDVDSDSHILIGVWEGTSGTSCDVPIFGLKGHSISNVGKK